MLTPKMNGIIVVQYLYIIKNVVLNVNCKFSDVVSSISFVYYLLSDFNFELFCLELF